MPFLFGSLCRVESQEKLDNIEMKTVYQCIEDAVRVALRENCIVLTILLEEMSIT